MKSLILFFILVLAGIQMKAQENPFKNFEIQHGGFHELFILSPDFEQEFEALKQEFLIHDYYRNRDSLQLTDSLYRWLFYEKIELIVHGNDYIFGNLIPDSLKQRLRENEDKIAGVDATYFSVYALVNSDGKVLSLYFKIKSDVLGWLRENELQVIYDGIMQSTVDISRIEFSRYSGTIFKKFVDTVVGSSMTGQERMALFREMVEKNRISCKYGVIKCFSMNKNDLIQEKLRKEWELMNTVKGKKAGALLEGFQAQYKLFNKDYAYFNLRNLKNQDYSQRTVEGQAHVLRELIDTVHEIVYTQLTQEELQHIIKLKETGLIIQCIVNDDFRVQEITFCLNKEEYDDDDSYDDYWNLIIDRMGGEEKSKKDVEELRKSIRAKEMTPGKVDDFWLTFPIDRFYEIEKKIVGLEISQQTQYMLSDIDLGKVFLEIAIQPYKFREIQDNNRLTDEDI